MCFILIMAERKPVDPKRKKMFHPHGAAPLLLVIKIIAVFVVCRRINIASIYKSFWPKQI